jgi:hypothetical protein
LEVVVCCINDNSAFCSEEFPLPSQNWVVMIKKDFFAKILKKQLLTLSVLAEWVMKKSTTMDKESIEKHRLSFFVVN